MRTKHLSIEERQHGKKALRRFFFLNGLGFPLMADATVTLIALHYGAGNMVIGYISIAITLTGVLTLVFPYLFQGIKINTVFFWAWFARSVTACLFFLLPFIPREYTIPLIVITYTLWVIGRQAGVILLFPIQNTVIKPYESGVESAKNHRLGFASGLLARVISFTVTSIHSLGGAVGLLLLETVGIIANIGASWQLRDVPCREVVEKSDRKDLMTVTRRFLRNTELKKVFLLYAFAFSIIGLFAFTIPFFKIVLDLSANHVFAFLILNSVASIVVATAIAPFSDRLGSKPFLIMSYLAMIILMAAWALLPPLPWPVYFVFGSVYFLFIAMNITLISRLILKTTPPEKQITYNTLLYVLMSVVTLATGLGAGGLSDLGFFLMDRGGPIVLVLSHGYSLTFLLAAGIAFLCLLQTIYLKDAGSVSLKSAASTLLSAQNLRAVINIHELESGAKPERKEMHFINLERSPTPLATAVVKRYLNSSIMAEQDRALVSLFHHPRRELLNDIMTIAADPMAYARRIAIFTLGHYPGQKTRRFLRSMLGERDRLIHSAVVKSLARIGDTSIRDEALRMTSRPGMGAIVTVNYFVAAVHSDPEGRYMRHFFRVIDDQYGPNYIRSVATAVSQLLELSPPLSFFLDREHEDRTAGLTLLLDEARQFVPFDRDHETLVSLYRKKRFADMLAWGQARCRELEGGPAAWREFRRGLLSLAPAKAHALGMLIMCYGLYQGYKTVNQLKPAPIKREK